ncbi:MAG: hypothetical protein LUQ17_04540 [Methanomicrobiales archaeon]|nr:hypothetical protein [Methanomicrobiales archaeon]
MIDMIGEMVGELTGKVIGQRIVRHHHGGGGLKIERTVESKGKVLGEEVTMLATFWSTERPQGGMAARGHGILMTAKGEKAMVKGMGISVSHKGAGWSMRGARFMQSSAPALKRLNDVALVFEMDISPDGAIHDKWWEWK